MDDFSVLIRIVEISVERNGADKPLTLGHLLNILKLVRKQQTASEEKLQKAFDEVMNDHHRYGNNSNG